MTEGITDGQSLLGVAVNSKNTGVRDDSNATLDEIKFRLVCVCSFFRADFTAMKLRQYGADEFDFHFKRVLLLIAFLMIVRPNTSDKN